MKIQWITEVEAAAKLDCMPETLRRYAKADKWSINYTSISNRHFHYNEVDMDKLLIAKSLYLVKKRNQLL